jgi:hypothetical protein
MEECIRIGVYGQCDCSNCKEYDKKQCETGDCNHIQN